MIITEREQEKKIKKQTGCDKGFMLDIHGLPLLGITIMRILDDSVS